jgi:hypothetical protein
MDALDGNAIAGPLYEHFGAEMTTARGACGHCATPAEIAELAVYMRAPGTVVRCRHCGGVAIVLVEVGSSLRVDMSGFRLVSRQAPSR